MMTMSSLNCGIPYSNSLHHLSFGSPGLCSPVVPDVLEQVEGLLQAVGLIVLPDHHVVAATGHHEDDGCYICVRERQPEIRHSREKGNQAEKATARRNEAKLPLKHWIHFRRSSL